MIKYPILALLALIFIPILRAQITIPYQVTPGSGSKNNGSTLIGESFTTDSSAQFLTSLDIYVNNGGYAPGNFTLSLYAVSGSAANYAPSGSALFSTTYSNSILSSIVGTSYLFNNLSWPVASNTTYMVAFEGSASPTVKWQNAANSETSKLVAGTTGQNRYSAGGVVNTSYYAMTVTTSAIPEPATYAVLAGIGSLALAVWRRCRISSPGAI
jgi:hypothetical protein